MPDVEPRILRLLIGLHANQHAHLVESVEVLTVLGFQPDPLPRSYRETLLLDLTRPESVIFSGLHPTARRHIRAVDKRPVSMGSIGDTFFAPRMEELLCESFARTGGIAPVVDWPRLIKFSTENPGLSKMVGLYQDGVQGPDGLLAFAWGCFHGDHVHYAAAGSTRKTDLRMPLGYGLMWELIRWGKATGAMYFDLGGITVGEKDSGDPRAGISRFKRFFASEMAEVGAEFMLEPRPRVASTARMVSSGGRWLKDRLRRKRRGR
jgi:hypothetical protein